MSTTKSIVENVLTPPTTKKLWTSIYMPALPFTPQDFTMGAVMPAVLYMFRWGHRRGKGTFVKTFGKTEGDKLRAPTIDDVVNKLINDGSSFSGFDTKVGKAILGDMLLSFCLENKNHLTGRTEQVQRAYPTHYLASWIDLPQKVTNLRHIPEMLVALLASQEVGEVISRNNRRSHFSVGADFKDNILLSLFGTGMQIRGTFQTDLTSDQFTELNTGESNNMVGLDQLLTVRIAQCCGEAPLRARGGGESESIPNLQPLAQKAAKSFREDLSVFVQAYGETIPRQTFLQMLESCLSLGLTNIYLSTAGMLFDWERNGVLPRCDAQQPWPLFVDCSSGNEINLRRLSEESLFDLLRRFERLPVIMMCLRVLDDKVQYDRSLRNSLPIMRPDSTDYINLLGSIFKEDHSRAEKIFDNLDETCLKLADGLKDAEEAPSVQDLLKQNGNPTVRLAEALCILMGNDIQIKQFLSALQSFLMIDQPNGLAKKRRIYIKDSVGRRSSSDARSIVLTNTMLDFVVHRHLRKAAKGKGPTSLAFIDLIKLLKERYGLYIDEAPPGMSIPSDMLRHNRQILEKRLRDLGVLIGVNDAESMKRLQQRFLAAGDKDVE
jgi:hypothetical protein